MLSIQLACNSNRTFPACEYPRSDMRLGAAGRFQKFFRRCNGARPSDRFIHAACAPHQVIVID